MQMKRANPGYQLSLWFPVDPDEQETIVDATSRDIIAQINRTVQMKIEETRDRNAASLLEESEMIDIEDEISRLTYENECLEKRILEANTACREAEQELEKHEEKLAKKEQNHRRKLANHAIKEENARKVAKAFINELNARKHFTQIPDVILGAESNPKDACIQVENLMH